MKAIAPFITLGVLTLTALMGASYLLEQNGQQIAPECLAETEPALLYNGKPPWERTIHLIPVESLSKESASPTWQENSESYNWLLPLPCRLEHRATIEMIPSASYQITTSDSTRQRILHSGRNDM